MTRAVEGIWLGCRTCALAYWMPYGQVDRHRCERVCHDEGELERADEVAEELNELEDIFAAAER